MNRNYTKSFEILRHWDDLPDDAIVSTRIAAFVLGCAERTVRYHSKLTRVQISRGRYGFRTGDLRRIVRGEAAERNEQKKLAAVRPLKGGAEAAA